MAQQQGRYLLIQRADIRQAAPQHYHVGVQQIDHRGQAARQLLAVALQRLLRRGLAGLGGAGQLLGA
ncbi:hypothetical protein D3C84_1168290 [compost metagenome]